MLQRLDSADRVLAVLGTLHDDGLNGDAKAGDGVFTLVSSFKEFTVGPFSLRVSATFNGSVNHVFSSSATLTVTGTAPPTVTITSPANLSYLNISPTTVTGTVSDSAATVVINSISAPVVNGTFTASIPLAEGPNILTATTASASGSTGTASITVTLDTTPPHVTITSPTDQFITTASTMSISGNVNDTVVGTVNSQQAQVTVNGTSAQVANRTFLAANITLNMGVNTIRAVAVDRVGNSATTQITVVRQAPQPGQIQLTSGNNQSGTIGTALSAPLVISLTEASGDPAVNKPVIFSVTQNNGTLSVGNGQPGATVMTTTNAQGQAAVTWKVGMRSGAGSDGVQAYAVGYSGTAVFTASANQGPPGIIVIDFGNNQTGAVNQALPKPFIAVVTDGGYNRLANVPVTFTVNQGGGSFAGQPSTTVNTDSDGRAAASLVLGFQEGTSNNLVTADFPGNTGFPAAFTASGVGPGDPAKTVISGLVLDNSNQPIPGVSVRAVLTNTMNSNLGSVQAAAAVQTDAKGQFSITNAPVGFVKLFVDGSTATVPGVFPTLDYDMVTVAGQNNTVGQSIYLLPIKTTNQLCVTPRTGGGTLSIPEAPGFSLTFGPGQVTFPGGSKTGCVSVTVVHPDKVPMAPGFGQQPRFIVTIQPSGALFNPPAPITLPNVDGLAPRAVTEMYSFDHDIGSFVAIGTGSVSDDGLVIRSNQGVGVLKAGWHCGGNPNQPGTVATCPLCSFCQGTTCTPQGNGTPCGNGGTCHFTGQNTAPTCNCSNGALLNAAAAACPGPCPPGTSVIAGQCCQGTNCNPPPCPTGTVYDPITGTCVNGGPCPAGYVLSNGQCCQGSSCVPPQCPPGQTFDPVTGTCQSPCGTCSSANPCLDGSCGANNQCVFSPNQLCQNACHGATSGSCSVNGVSGTCDASGNCDLCRSLGAGASCTCGGGASGTCNSSGQCNCASPSVTITGISSDQLPGRACNVLPGGPADNNPMLLGARSGRTVAIIVKAQVSPPSSTATGFVGARDKSSQMLYAAFAITGPQTAVTFDMPDDQPREIEIVGGIDVNNDSRFSQSEVSSVYGGGTLNPVTQARYDSTVTTLRVLSSVDLGANLFLPVTGIASDFLNSFISRTVPSGVLATPVTLFSTDSRLSHPVGQDWLPNCSAAGLRYVFPDDHPYAVEFANSCQLRQIINQTLDEHRAEVDAFFRSQPTATRFINNSPWSPTKNTCIGGIDTENGNCSANTKKNPWVINSGLDFTCAKPSFFLAFGDVDVMSSPNPLRITVEVRATDRKIVNLHVQGTLLDLYDFSQKGIFGKYAAPAQAGYASLGIAGRTFETGLDYKLDSSSWDYYFQ
jgi:hypothetical protein